jgi:hypothetical protein
MACSIRGRPPLQMAQDRVGAADDAHLPKQPLARQAAGRMAGRIDQCLHLVGDPSEWPRNAIKSFGESYAPTAPIQTSEPSDSRMEDHPSGLYRQILNPTMVGAVDARRRSPAPHSFESPTAPTVRRTANANIRAERPVDLGLHDPFLPVMGDMEQIRAPKLRKTQLMTAAPHKVAESHS